jgi:putative spermidine/putrescine transport system ATP-binding protein
LAPFIHFDKVTKAFGPLRVVDNLDLRVEKGEFLSLLGPSGSGKTTMLMMLAGFEDPTEGAIWLDGVRIESLPSHRRNMGVVFQSYALFPHMTVAENVAFPLAMRGIGKAEAHERVARALDMVRLGHLKDRRPSQLSGGQQQRVALTRALVFEPSVVLMDEPLGALDKQLREHMQLELRDLHRKLGLTVIFVTHDQSEALTMSDRIAVFNAGKIEQLDTPEGIYDRPKTRFVAEFIGETNLFEGVVQRVEGDVAEVALKGGLNVRATVTAPVAAGASILASVRPERMHLRTEAGSANVIPVTIADNVYQGDHLRSHLSADGITLVAKVERRVPVGPVGSSAFACFEPAECTLIVP